MSNRRQNGCSAEEGQSDTSQRRSPAIAQWLGYIVRAALGATLVLSAPCYGESAGRMSWDAACAAQEDAGNKTLSEPHAFTPAASATALMPAGTVARLLYAKPINAQKPQTFRVFQTDNPLAQTVTSELPVISVRQISDQQSAGEFVFLPANSTALEVQTPPDWFPFYHSPRKFLILECVDSKLIGLGSVTTRVSGLVAAWLCVPVVLLGYFLSMYAVYISRSKSQKDPLGKKYPAVFGAKPLTRADFFNPIHLTGNAFNRGSVQKLQVLVFTFLVASLLLIIVLRTGKLTNLSTTIVALLGISGIGAAVSQATYITKVRLTFPNWAWLQAKKILMDKDPVGPEWKDLVLTNREFDVYKLQTLVFSAAVAIALIAAGGTNLASFTIPPELLAILGLSHAVYVGGILVRPPAESDLDDELKKLRDCAETYSAALKQQTDVDADGKLLPTPLPPGKPVAALAKARYEKLAEQIIPMIESTLEVEVDKGNLLRAPLMSPFDDPMLGTVGT